MCDLTREEWTLSHQGSALSVVPGLNLTCSNSLVIMRCHVSISTLEFYPRFTGNMLKVVARFSSTILLLGPRPSV